MNRPPRNLCLRISGVGERLLCLEERCGVYSVVAYQPRSEDAARPASASLTERCRARDGYAVISEQELTPAEVEQIATLARQPVPAEETNALIGVDGQSYELSWDDERGHVSYAWWMGTTAAWAPLGEIAKILRARFTFWGFGG